MEAIELKLSNRQRIILERVLSSGYVTIEALAAEFDVSAQTVRRDIIVLSNAGRLQRFHGGAGPVDGAEAARLDHLEKREIAWAEKEIIGRRAAAAVPQGATIFLDVGTTIERCAQELAQRPGFRIFTNSIRTAMVFDPSEHEVYVIGGRLTGRDGSLTGEEVILRLQDVHLDIALIACSAVDANGRVMDFDASKIAIKKAAMATASAAYLLATYSKFNRVAVATIAPLERFDKVFTDEKTGADPA
jgi:DeoR family glycerol-3-phosphate regulon repressor